MSRLPQRLPRFQTPQVTLACAWPGQRATRIRALNEFLEIRPMHGAWLGPFLNKTKLGNLQNPGLRAGTSSTLGQALRVLLQLSRGPSVGEEDRPG